MVKMKVWIWFQEGMGEEEIVNKRNYFFKSFADKGSREQGSDCGGRCGVKVASFLN